MRLPKRFSFWLKAAEAALVAVAVCFSLGATSPSGRLNDLDHRLMCECGCSQLLGECDHVGCPDRDKELTDLRSDIAAGDSDQQILNSFVGKYGAAVLAAPTMHGFDLVAWIAPFAVFAAALLGTLLLIRRWGGFSGGWWGGSTGSSTGGKTPATATDPASLDPAERERLERIRRETGAGGF